MALTKAEILTAGQRLQTKLIDVPEWGGQVLIRELRAGQRDQLEAAISAIEPGSTDSVRARALMVSVIDDAGNLLFDVSDLPSLAELGNIGADRIFQEIVELNRMRPDKKAKAIEDAAKN
jgi:hypothetical protein